MARAVERVIEDLIEIKKKEKSEPGKILLLGRYGFDGDHLERTGLFEYVNRTNKVKSVKYPKLDITFMTAHSSKGLGYDDVIVINGKNETYGFPSKVEDDPVLSFVIKGDRSIDYAEERRLFYVAMTRTKNRVYFIAPEENPSEFLVELKQTYKNVKLLGEWNEDEPVSIVKKPCPICGYPMQFKYKRAYGLPLYICTNEPELCGFMTNAYQAGKLCVQKCDKCRDGYLIVKPGRDKSYFLGCTNYKRNGTGCNNTINKQAYYEAMGYDLEKEEPVSVNKENRKTTKRIIVEDGLTVTKQKSTQYKKDYVYIQKADISGVMYEGYDLNDVVYNILCALQNISMVRFYGISTLCDVLHGSNSQKIFKAGLDKIPEYGLYRKLSREDLKAIVEWLLDEHYILQTKGQYPVLHSTYEGLHYSETMMKKKYVALKKYLES